MVLYTYLPLLRGWRYDVVDVDRPIVIPAGTTKLVHHIPYPGWLIAMMCSLNNPYTDIMLKYCYKGGEYSANFMPYSLKEAGMTSPNPGGFWVSRYDDTLKVYVVMYMPTLYSPFASKCDIYVTAPTTSSITILDYSSVGIVIEDMDDFIKSFQEVLGVRKKD